jgi:hypothetical protein
MVLFICNFTIYWKDRYISAQEIFIKMESYPFILVLNNLVNSFLAGYQEWIKNNLVVNQSYVPFISRCIPQFKLYQVTQEQRLKKNKNYKKRNEGLHEPVSKESAKIFISRSKNSAEKSYTEIYF